MNMEYIQVRVPMMEVIPLRHAEKGSTLEFDAFSRDGKLIAEEGTTLTEDQIKRFKNFNVRKVVVTSPREQWVPKSEKENLSPHAEVIQEREFSEAAEEILEDVQSTDSAKKMRKTALYLRRQASRAGDEEGARYLDDLIERSEQLEEEIEELTDKLDSVEDEEAREEIMDALEGKVRQLEETFMEVAAPDSMLKDTLNVVNEREEIRHSLTDFVHENLDLVNREFEEGEEDEEPDAIEADNVDDDVAGAIQHFNRGESVEGVESLLEDLTEIEGRVSHEVEDELTDLHKQLSGQQKTISKFKKLLSQEVDDLEARKTLIDVLDGRKTVNRQELMELPISRSFASKTYELVEDRMESHHQIWQVLQAVSEEDLSEQIDRSQFLDRSIRKPSEEPEEDERKSSLPEGDLVEVFGAMSEGNVREGLETLEHKMDQSEKFDAKARADVVMAREKLSDIASERDDLIQRVKEEIEEEETESILVSLIKGDRPFDPDELMSLDADMKLLEDVGDFVTKQNVLQQELWETLDQVSGGALYGDSDGSSEVVREKIEGASDVLNINKRASRDWKGDQSNGSGESEPTRSREESAQKPILEVVEEGDEYDIANRTGLELSEVKAADTLLVPPHNLSGDQQILFDPLIRQLKMMFYGRKAREKEIRDIMKKMSAELEREKRPFKMVMTPPGGKQYILTHGLNTTLMTVLLSHYFELSESEMLDVTAASLASDLGMVNIPTALWLKEEHLTQRGEKEVQRHPELSNEIVGEAFNGDGVIQDLVGQHHERLDGSGYPHFMEKENQHPLAPIVAAADAYTAMVEPRPHRNEIPPNKALINMLKSKGQYDRSVIKGLVNKVGIYPNGSIALLDDARLALVHSQNPDHPLKPTVLLLTDKSRNRLDDPHPLDLTEADAPSVSRLAKY